MCVFFYDFRVGFWLVWIVSVSCVICTWVSPSLYSSNRHFLSSTFPPPEMKSLEGQPTYWFSCFWDTILVNLTLSVGYYNLSLYLGRFSVALATEQHILFSLFSYRPSKSEPHVLIRTPVLNSPRLTPFTTSCFLTPYIARGRDLQYHTQLQRLV